MLQRRWHFKLRLGEFPTSEGREGRGGKGRPGAREMVQQLKVLVTQTRVWLTTASNSGLWNLMPSLTSASVLIHVTHARTHIQPGAATLDTKQNRHCGQEWWQWDVTWETGNATDRPQEESRLLEAAKIKRRTKCFHARHWCQSEGECLFYFHGAGNPSRG